MPRLLCILYGTALALLAGCSLFSDDEEQLADRFFPLKVGQEWTYEVTESSSIDTSDFGDWIPKRITTSVVGTRSMDRKKYFLLHNYFVPGPDLPDTILVRNEDSRVFIRLHPEDEEIIFYSFAPPDTTWVVPMYANPEWLLPRGAVLEDWSNDTATVRWGRFTESTWEDVFEAGIGRVEIRSSSMGWGRIVWTLQRSR